MTWQHKFKCFACGLHFIVLSWDEEWYEKHKPTCPECKQESAFFAYWREETDDPIYKMVPGEAGLASFGVRGGS